MHSHCDNTARYIHPLDAQQLASGHNRQFLWKSLAMKLLTPSSASVSSKLFLTGATVGPIVDSLHNQCLLKYNIAPISLAWPSALYSPLSPSYEYFFCSSWTVPPLLGIAYVVLGGVLPQFFEWLLYSEENQHQRSKIGVETLRTRALLAVSSTALIIKLSEFLETNPTATDSILPFNPSDAHLAVMIVAAVSQWAILDRTVVALLVATITAIGGPLSELPFVANGFWEYLDQASDYFPLAGVNNGFLQSFLGENYQGLALSSITGPCYFAVTTDAIALGRWFQYQSFDDEGHQE